ncbi:MAG: ATP-dependent DNA helicase RecG [Bacillota bacterium]|nr:ATP-dependent DNA helicase RecG [Bacillota bacterium]
MDKRAKTRDEAAELYDVPLERLKGIGPRRAELFRRLGVASVGDLLYHLPRRYEDMSNLTPIGRVVPGKPVTVRGRVVAVRETRARHRRLYVVKAVVGDGTGTINALWFVAGRRLPLVQRLAEAGEILLHGTAVAEETGLVIKNGEWDAVARDSLHLQGIVPVYPATEGLPGRVIRSAVAGALSEFGPRIADPLPLELVKRQGFVALSEALRQVHFPRSAGEAARARRRLAFDELLLFQLALGLRRQWREGTGRGIRFAGPFSLTRQFRAKLPFTLTPAQERVIDEILGDMAAPRPMERLLLGDVGAGKTVVAAAALVRAVECGYQGALMAPTAILADQHCRTLTALLCEVPVRVGLLTSGQEEERCRVLARAAAGELDVVIGTHALLEEGVRFARLGLVVIDEQHRFGVRQRAALASKGRMPDVLVMSATPIPRTLALTLYGDLELSILDGSLPGRKPVQTRWLSEEERPRVYDFLRRQAAAGRQSYVVCPLVAEGEESSPGIKNAVEEAQRLAAVLPGLRIGVLHGQLRAEEKDEVMRRFRDHELDVLVATTVIELGVDVTTAAVMVVENAERFGLAQLHQLRGRVGRGAIQGWCLLFGEPQTEKGKARMAAFARLSSGQALAEADLKLRGPGEFFGTRQAGLPEFHLPLEELFGNTRAVEEARRSAREILAGDPQLALPHHRGLAQALRRRFGALLDGAEGQLCG